MSVPPTNAAKFRTTAPIFPVCNLKASMIFYVGMGYTGHAYDQHYAMISRGESEIHLRVESSPLKEQNPSGAYFYLTSGIAELQAEFLANNVPIISPLEPREWSMNEFQVSDPDGNLLRFGQPL